jgi:glutathione S-transferase
VTAAYLIFILGGNMEIVICGRHTSYNVQKVLWLLDELELEYQHIELGSQPEETDTEEFVRLKSYKKSPCA